MERRTGTVLWSAEGTGPGFGWGGTTLAREPNSNFVAGGVTFGKRPAPLGGGRIPSVVLCREKIRG